MSLPSSTGGRPKLLVLELWGLGDLTFALPLLHAATAAGWEITLVGKPHARALLEPTFPDLRFIAYDAPWTAFRGKYRLWKWDHPAWWRLLRRLRSERFDAAVSVRPDPRDHVLLWLAGARRRYGFPHRLSGPFLTDPVRQARPKQHKVEDWRALRGALGLAPVAGDEPALAHARYRSPAVDALFADVSKPVICLHTGARIAVRRWPLAYYVSVLGELRRRLDFHLLLITDPDGAGRELAPLADSVAPPMSLGELVDTLGRVELLLCNDSGPMHIAASCGRPVIALFGPTDPDWFRPWGTSHHVVLRDLCALRPCFDYCPFPEPYCLTKLLPETAAPEIVAHAEEVLARLTPG